MSIKVVLAAAAAACATAAIAATSTPAGWTDDFEAAKARAAKENKILLVDFSGSDWCGWCKKLDREVFSKKEFTDAVANDFILVMIDSPRDKNLLSEKAKKQNPELVKKFDVHGFPTVLLMDAEGSVIERTGYREGGPAAYAEYILDVKKSARAIIALKRDIAGMEKGNPARLAKIDAVFKNCGKDIQDKNANLIQELLDNDPAGEYAARYPYMKHVKPLEIKLRKAFVKFNRKFSKRLKELAGDGKQPGKEHFEAARKETDEFARKELEALRAEALAVKSTAPASAQKDIDKFVKHLDDIIERTTGDNKRPPKARKRRGGKKNAPEAK